MRAYLWLAVVPACAFSRPALPELPLGTGAASFAGGGTAHASGLNSLFDNPAALSLGEGMRAETGLMGLASGLSPYFLFGSQGAGNSSYALGYFYDARPGEPKEPVRPRQGLVAGASWEALPWASLGASVRSVGTGAGVGLDGFGIDEDAGAILRPWRALWMGLAVRNLQESGVAGPQGFRTRRSYALSAGTGLASLHVAGMTIHDPDGYYELRSSGPPFAGRMAEAFSLGARFTPGGKLGFRGTLLLPHGESPGFALGMFLKLPIGRSALDCAYTFQSGAAGETGEAGASHSISLGLRFGGRADPIPPVVEVHADKALVESADADRPVEIFFSLSARDEAYASGRPAGDGEEPEAAQGSNGRLIAADAGSRRTQGRVRDWNLVIRAVGPDGLAGPEVKRFQGKDLPPRMIRWDGRTDRGARIPPGFYSFRLEAVDAAGNRGGTGWQLLEYRRVPSPAGS